VHDVIIEAAHTMGISLKELFQKIAKEHPRKFSNSMEVGEGWYESFVDTGRVCPFAHQYCLKVTADERQRGMIPPTPTAHMLFYNRSGLGQ
jgi:hypothetical protein